MATRLYRHIALGFTALLAACGGADAPSSGDPRAGQENARTGAPSSGLSADSQAGTQPTVGAGSSIAIGSVPPIAGANGSVPDGGNSSSPGGSAAGPTTPDLPPPVPSSEANAILTRAERAYSQIRAMEADFTQEVYVPLLEATQNSRGRLFHRAPDRFLMRFTDPAGDVIVADGQSIWMYYPSTDDGQVIRAPLSSTGQQANLYREFLADATSRFAASLDGSESVGGRPAKALTLIPRQASPYRRVRIWVDDQDSFVRKFEISEENGSVRMLQLSGLRLNGTLADDLFRFTPPPGVQVHDF